LDEIQLSGVYCTYTYTRPSSDFTTAYLLTHGGFAKSRRWAWKHKAKIGNSPVNCKNFRERK